MSNFQTFELHDLDEREAVAFPLADLPAHVESFGFILGVQRRTFRDQGPANIKAAELVGRLHDALADAGHRGHDLERFLVRVVFCMFADDTGVFEPRDIFLDFIETRTSEDGADVGPWLAQLFEVLDTPEDERAATLDEDLARFPYVNGDLFEGHLRTFSFDTAMRGALLDACRSDWSNISPAIFGALFQSVMDPAERRAQGAHYTTEKNILKVIELLFMDDLRGEFERVRKRRGRGRLAALRQFQAKLGSLTFFDPACGCGNFLITAYRELRLLEIEVIRNIREATAVTGQAVLDAAWQSVVDVDQFYGIELGEFPARIARIGFVATNSITQGEQVAQLWPVLFGRCKLEIAFAHRTFAWGSDARGKAHVHVVILGLDRRKAARAEKRLFSYPDINGDAEESRHAALSPYLFDAGGLSDPHLVVREESAPINGMSRLIIGSKPIDGGNYIFDAAEHAAFLEAEPEAAPYLRPYVGAREYLQGGERCILARAIGAVSRDGVDDRAGSARQPHRARPGLRVWQVDALASNPVPFERDDFAETASGQHQQPDDGDDVRAIELVAGQYRVEPGHLLRRQKALSRLQRVAPGVLARVRVVNPVTPKLGHAHHHRQGGHGAVGAAGPVGHGREPVLDMLDGDGVHGQMAEGGQDVLAHDIGAVRQRPGLPVPGVAFEELPGEGVHRAARRLRAIVLPRRFDEAGDEPARLGARLWHGHRIGAADGGRADASAHGPAQEERAVSARSDAKGEAGNHIVPYVVLLGTRLGGADAPGEGRLGVVGHGLRLLLLSRATGRSK